ncbi:MAG: DUF928 domain-containing protein [Pelatocladus maniniholoensis HA4357-MV3]|jgi:hypothetical protein|uniref:DUF928 domain-containing protein n=1 Tax=Pelatocladus maniniholoensis HA4357-MV3 TaxID=1117104 RepID=A0A9E3H824_9NOST|nr:DUF928 domain-containing protein [Pelatocladus maniniholoensis HA4357-MV3]BAZ67211.1 hypothetical protein NIES4106_19650 [Fischerella sp. NIES-4106]
MYRPNYLKISLSLLLKLLLCGLPSVAFTQTIAKPQTSSKPNQVNNRNQQSGSVQVKVPTKSLPGRRENGSTRRGGCIFGEQPLLVLLLPSTNLGLTTAAYPKFFWYIPDNTAQTMLFSLHTVDEKLRPRNLVYQTNFKPSSKATITSLTLPNNDQVQPLTINQTYQWSVSIVCDIQDPSPRSVISVHGWVQRVAIKNNVANRLKRSTSRERLSVYAEQGLWFDLLSTVVELRACSQSDTKVSDIWTSLLQQIELDYLAKQPLRQQCPPR